MRVVDEEGGSDGSQSAVGGIEERVGGLVVLRSDPFALEHAPERLRDVELRRVRREGGRTGKGSFSPRQAASP